jgi:acetyltransferase-like isoleucine patch superfamily enzyme
MRFGAGFHFGQESHIVSEKSIVFAEDCSIGERSFVGPREPHASGVLRVGNGTHLQRETLLDLCGDVTIGANVRTGPFCAFYTHNHVQEYGKLIWEQQPRFSSITVGSGVWIGHNCSFMAGAQVGDQAIIATGAVVTKNVEPYVTAAGVPARAIRTLFVSQDNCA